MMMMSDQTHIARTAHPRRTATQWLLIWPVLFAVVMFASLNPVTCLIHCAAQSAHTVVVPPQPNNILFCVVDEFDHLTQGWLGQTTGGNSHTLMPQAVHELVLLASFAVVTALVLLYTVYPAALRTPFMATVPPNPPPRFA